MIIGRDLMVHLGLLVNLKFQFLQWYGFVVPIKDPSILIGQIDLTSFEVCEGVIYTAEPVSTREATEIMVKILDSTYAKSYLEQVDTNVTHMNSDENTQPLGLIK